VTLDALAPAASPAGAGTSYWRRTYGARAWKELFFLVLGFPLGMAGLVFVVATSFASAFFLITLIGIPILFVSLAIDRWVGSAYRWLGRSLLDLDVPEPAPRPPRDGFLATLGGGLSDTVAWRARAYQLLRAPLSVAGFLLGVGTWGYGLWLATYALWFRALTSTDAEGRVHHGFSLGNGYGDGWPAVLVFTALGLGLLLLAPWVVRGATSVERLLLHGLLGPTLLTERVHELEVTRAAAVDTSAASIRRIERDLHDGTQAQLVALAMKLGVAKEELDTAVAPEDVARARDLVDAAHRSAKEALGELRDLVKGIHPPALDLGLENALQTLVARAPLPIALQVELPARPSPAIESIAYFCVAELLTNVARHSGATRASVVAVAEGPDALRVTVFDDGHGGAAITDEPDRGTGLRGLESRVASVDGTLSLLSPPAGPTVVTIHLPMRA
jgi:signal transduction histidine kinase